MAPMAPIGREREVEELRAATEAAREGRGRVVLVTGVAGIGKTTLLRHAAALARDAGLDVRTAAGLAMEATSPFGVVRRLLAGTPAEALVTADGDRAAPGTLEELLRAVAALVWPDAGDPRHRPMLLAVDDLQWADSWSARFVAALAGHAEDLPVVVLVATRPSPGEVGAALDPVLARPHARSLRLGPLGDEGVREVLRRSGLADPGAGLVRAVREATGGNPFYAEAVARLLREGQAPETVSALVPEDVLRSVVGRLAGLGSQAVALARAVSVLGPGHPLRLAARLAGLEAAEADEVADAMAAAALLAPGEPVRFAHPLVAAAVEADQPAFAVSRLHRRAADLLAGEGAPSETVGEHLVRTRGDGDPAVAAALRDAAAVAMRRGAPTAAGRFLQRALEEPPPAPDRVAVLLDLVDARAMAADTALLDEAPTVVEQLSDRDDRVRALSALATLAHHFGDFTQALALLEQGLAELEPARRASSRLQEQWLSTALLTPEHHTAAEARLRELIDDARAGTLPPSPGLGALAAVEAAARDEAELVERLADVAFTDDPLVEKDLYGTALGYVGAALTWVGAYGTAVRRMDAALLEARHRGAVVAQAVAHHWRGIAGLQFGRLDDALTDGERTAALHARGWTDSAWSIPLLIDVWLARGEVARARALADEGPEDPSRPDFAMFLESRGRLLLAEHDPCAALKDAERAGELIEGVFGRVMPRAFGWRVVAADASLALGRVQDARRHARDAVELARPLATPAPLGRALCALGRALDDGDAEGLACHEEAVAVLEGTEARLAHAEALGGLGVALRRAGRRDAARDVLLEAFALADDLGAQTLAATARAELNVLGSRPRRAARSGVASLTPGELRVVELAAHGLSNPQIAHHLVISRRTVETHLARAYRKLGVDGRGDLALRLGEGR